MAITYIIGRAGTGKSQYVMSQIKERLQEKQGHPLILIVPEQFTLQAERDLIEKQQLKGIMGVEVLSFTRLAFRVFNEVGGLTKTPINEIGKNMIIRKILEECREDLSVYKNPSKQEGFVKKLNEMICEFKQQNIAPIELLQGINEVDEDSIMRMKLEDIALIYGKFNSYLENRYIDNEDNLNLFIESIEKASFLENAEIWIDGFHLFTPQSLKIVEKLLLKVKDVYITFTMTLDGKGSDKELFRISEKTYLQIKRIAEELKLQEIIINLDRDKIAGINKSKEICHIEEELFRYPYKQFTEEVKNLKVFTGTNPYAEIEHVAAEILQLVRERGYRFKDIAVVSADFEGYSGMIKRTFEEYGIPYFMDEKRSIMNNPIVELILTAIETILNNYQYKDIFRLVKTGFTDLTKEEGEILENYVLQYGIRGKRWMEDFHIGEETEKLEELNRIRNKLITPLNKFHKKIARSKNPKEITKGLFGFLLDMQIEEKLDLWIEALKTNDRFDYANENTQIWNIVMEIFDQIYEILEDNKTSIKEYYRILESGFSACEIGVIPSTIDQVLVGTIDRSRSHDIKALLVVAANDGILPSTYSDEGILLDHERKTLGELGLPLEVSGETKLLQENFSIYSAFSKPAEYLWISFPLADGEGKAKRPSILIDRIKKLFPKLQLKGDLLRNEDTQLHLIATPLSTFKYLTENLRLYMDGKPIHLLWWDVYHWYYHHPQWQEKKNLMIEGLFYENQVKYIHKGTIRNLYDLPMKTSVSRLESFVNCPFSHFVTYGLRPKERKEYQIKGPDVGMFFHYSMEAFASKTKERDMNWMEMEKKECHEIIHEVMQQLSIDFQHGVMLSTHRYKYLINRLTQISKKALWTLIEHIKSGEFLPFDHEVAFGRDEKIPAIVIELEDGEEIILEGRIDRVDIMMTEEDTYLKVIDYKSGNKKFSLSDVYYGFQLQLIVYLEAMMALQDKVKKTRNHPAGVFYFKIDDPMVKTADKAVDKIESEINKQLKMKGLVLKDLKIVKGMDKHIEKHSEIIPVALNKDESIGKKSSVATEEEFQDIIKHVRSLIKEIGKEILKGNVKIEPCKKGKQVSCQYCSYQSICQFDNVFDDNKYKIIKELKPEEVLEKIKEGKEGDGNEGMD
ncbi:DNA helicase/exodeoxyribonuclease V, subunit B [Natronincola peptidivorans]|uniref:ATP-dependent helicase/deoxyribonuclease subunit B n=1 Tax=Natronincola peptidivorans TaxID=426128 RepID=A0A1I0BK68_9FIRM|nr:helicase-exonuclease AddAB subunit AddB [Natronincola peptidivorans]SET07332.1 DNA helicase/exodeoxyribonuclease V, subunit B [Natronincola peptidivorans]